MRLHTIPLLCLLLAPIVLAINHVFSPDYIEYRELNIYPYQHQIIECYEQVHIDKKVTPTPLDKGEYYVENPLEEMASNLKTARETKKLKDEFPELKVISHKKTYTLYYSTPGKHEKIERMYFECVNDPVPGSIIITQLNVMPLTKDLIDDEDNIIWDKLTQDLKDKHFSYSKSIRPGFETIAVCANSKLVIDKTLDYNAIKHSRHTTYSNTATDVVHISTGLNSHQYIATTNNLILDLRENEVTVINGGGFTIYCQGSPKNKLTLILPYANGIPGLNAYSQATGVVEFDDSMDVVPIKTEKDTRISVEFPLGLVRPGDCLHEVFTTTGEIVKVSEIVRNPKLVRMTESFKILDLSHASSYREITVLCYVDESQRSVWSKDLWMNLTISPQCNFYDPQALDSDGKTCTLFSSLHTSPIVVTPTEHMKYIHSSDAMERYTGGFEMEEAFFTRSDGSKGTCKDCRYKKIVEQDDDISVSTSSNGNIQRLTIQNGVIRHNPVYMLNKEEVKGDEVLNPTHIMRMYLYNHDTSIDEHGNVTVEKDHQVKKSGGKSAFYRAHIDGHKRIAISCKDFFEDSGPSEPILLPSGKNTIFENVSDGSVDPKKIKTAPFETLFQSKGIRILKKPAPSVDLEIRMCSNKVIQSDHRRPIYFICSPNVKGKWDSKKNPYAIIAIDPGYTYDGSQDPSLPEDEECKEVLSAVHVPPAPKVKKKAPSIATDPAVEPRQALDVETTKINRQGNVTVKLSKVKKAGKSILYRVQPGNKRDIKISCKDFFEDSGSSEYTLFPSGKNTVFENVSDGSVDPKTLKTIQFEQEFASRGISILKKPETDVDLQLIFDEDKLVQNEYIKPIYFICSPDVQGDWEKDKKPYAIIAIDPGYEIRKLQGCGVKDGMFLGQGESSPTGNQCMHTVDDETRVGFHCPSYVPEHFLEGDQSKHKAAEDAKAENPYQLLLRCYDRSTVGKRMFRPKRNLGLFSRPKFAGELRSLWVFDRNTFAEKKHLTDILCTCYDKTGKAISHIKIKNNTN